MPAPSEVTFTSFSLFQEKLMKDICLLGCLVSNEQDSDLQKLHLKWTNPGPHQISIWHETLGFCYREWILVIFSSMAVSKTFSLAPQMQLFMNILQSPQAVWWLVIMILLTTVPAVPLLFESISVVWWIPKSCQFLFTKIIKQFSVHKRNICLIFLINIYKKLPLPEKWYSL